MIYDELLKISIHSPQVRRDLNAVVVTMASMDFNPLSSSEERPDAVECQGGLIYFNPLSSSEERLGFHAPIYITDRISIHSPQVRRDLAATDTCCRCLLFQSTLLK